MPSPFRKSALALGQCTGDGYQIILNRLHEKLNSSSENLSVKEILKKPKPLPSDEDIDLNLLNQLETEKKKINA